MGCAMECLKMRRMKKKIKTNLYILCYWDERYKISLLELKENNYLGSSYKSEITDVVKDNKVRSSWLYTYAIHMTQRQEWCRHLRMRPVKMNLLILRE